MAPLRYLALASWSLRGCKSVRLSEKGSSAPLVTEHSQIPEEYMVIHDEPQYDYQTIYDWVTVHGSMKVRQGVFSFNPADKSLVYTSIKTGRTLPVSGPHDMVANDLEVENNLLTPMGSGSGGGSGSGSESGSGSGTGSGIPVSPTELDHYKPVESFPRKDPGCGEDLPDQAKRELLENTIGLVQGIRDRALADAQNIATSASEHASNMVGENVGRTISELTEKEVIMKACAKGLERSLRMHTFHTEERPTEEWKKSVIEKCFKENMITNEKAKMSAISTAYNTVKSVVHGESKNMAMQTANDTIAEAFNNAMQGEREKIDTAAAKAYNYAAHWVNYGHVEIQHHIDEVARETANATSERIAHQLGGQWALEKAREKSKEAVDIQMKGDLQKVAREIAQHAVDELWAVYSVPGSRPAIVYPPVELKGSGSGSGSGSGNGSGSGSGSGSTTHGSLDGVNLLEIRKFIRDAQEASAKQAPAPVRPPAAPLSPVPVASSVPVASAAVSAPTTVAAPAVGSVVVPTAVGSGSAIVASDASTGSIGSTPDYPDTCPPFILPSVEKTWSRAPQTKNIPQPNDEVDAVLLGAAIEAENDPGNKDAIASQNAAAAAAVQGSHAPGSGSAALAGNGVAPMKMDTKTDIPAPQGAVGDPVLVAKDGAVTAWPLANGGVAFKYPKSHLLVRYLVGQVEYLWGGDIALYARQTPTKREFWSTDGTTYASKSIDGTRVFQEHGVVTIVEKPGISVHYHWCNPNREVVKTAGGVSYKDGVKRIFRDDALGITKVEDPAKQVTTYKSDGSGDFTRETPESIMHWYPDSVVVIDKQTHDVSRLARDSDNPSPTLEAGSEPHEAVVEGPPVPVQARVE